MCGIIGSIGKYNEQDIRAAAATIAHRGPDAFGLYAHNNVVFAQHRLSILDLSEKGNQPYHFEHLMLVYNGEIYNFREIKKELTAAGYSFDSGSDTEMVIKSFHYWGVSAVNKFIGMFAFAVYDKNDNSIYLFRDRLGVKPLYYTVSDGLVFGSELRAILPFLKDKTIDNTALYEYFRVGYISGEKTIYKHAKKLKPGSYLHFKNNNTQISTYWMLQDIPELSYSSVEEWKEILHQTMIDAFRLRMVSDVPVGIFLSGGIDSSLVTSILQQHYGNIHTFTIGFNDDRYNEAPFARKVADHLGTNHTELTLTVSDAAEMFDHFYDIYDEPFADSSGIPSTIVSRLAAREGVKVVLSANGGDELFAGYNHYSAAMKLFNRFNGTTPVVRKMMNHVTAALSKTGILKSVFYNNIEHKIAVLNELSRTKELGNFYHAFLANQSDIELKNLLKMPVSEGNIRLLRQDMNGLMMHDILSYLPDDLLVKTDRATMYNSIEGREPFIDHRIVSLAFQMPLDLKWREGTTKWILKEILAGYVPRQLFERPKKGFSIPIFKWFSQHMDQLFEQYLHPDMISKTGLFNEDEVTREYRKYLYFKKRGQESNIEKMWRILSFMMWWEKWHKC